MKRDPKKLVIRKPKEGYINAPVYQAPEGDQFISTKFEEGDFKLMLGDLKKIKKNMVKSQQAAIEEQTKDDVLFKIRQREDF
jgi:hypothetical protein